MPTQSFPTLTPEARQLLEIILSKTAIDGSTLMRARGVSRAADLVAPIRELVSQDLIDVGGSLTESELPFSRFAVRPSAKDYIYRFLRSTA